MLAHDIIFSTMEEQELSWFLNIRNQVRQFLHNSDEFTLEECRKWFAETENLYFVVHIKSGETYQKCGYFRVRLLDTLGMAEIGMDLDPAFEGRNIAYSSYRKFGPFLRDNYKLYGFTLRVRSDNTRAMRLYKKLNFELLGEFEYGNISEFLMYSSARRLENLPT
jgi:RimJ/RimL family protein N-acetyltransferase